MLKEKLEEFDRAGIFNTPLPFELNKISDSAGKSEELSVKYAVKKKYQNYLIENGNKKDDFFIDGIPVQVKNKGTALLCSYNMKSIGDDGKMTGEFKTKEPFVEKIFSEIKDINFLELSGHNKYFCNDIVNIICLNYLGDFPILALYDKKNKIIVLVKTADYIQDKKFYCEIRSSGKNSTELIAAKQVKQCLELYKVDDCYIINKQEFNEKTKARNKDGESSKRLKFKTILPKYFFVNGKKVEKIGNRYKFRLEDIRQLVPTIAFYMEVI